MRTLAFVTGLLAVILAGCSTTSGLKQQVQHLNAAKEARHEPTRAQFKELGNGASEVELGIWAGIPGTTAANAEYRRKIFDSFKSSCGFDESDLKEVRVVKHAPPMWYEVWIFNNPKSRRPDKTTGISVVMTFNPTTNITKINFIGSCK